MNGIHTACSSVMPTHTSQFWALQHVDGCTTDVIYGTSMLQVKVRHHVQACRNCMPLLPRPLTVCVSCCVACRVACRRAYQRAIVIPSLSVDMLWKNYERWELQLGANKMFARKVGGVGVLDSVRLVRLRRACSAVYDDCWSVEGGFPSMMFHVGMRMVQCSIKHHRICQCGSVIARC